MRYLFFLLFLFWLNPTLAQPLLSDWSLRDARLMSTDDLGNVYIIFEDNSLVCYNAKGDSLASFRGLQYGELSGIDCRNPFKILAFYRDFSKVLILDRLLTVKNELDLRKLRLYQINAVAWSKDGNIWLYDGNAVQLLKIDENLKVLNQSDDLRASLQVFPQPISLKEGGRQIYLLDPKKGIFVFDQFANFLNTLPYQNVEEINTFNKELIYRSGDSLFHVNANNFEQTSMALPRRDSILATSVEQGKLYILFKNSLQIYNLAP